MRKNNQHLHDTARFAQAEAAELRQQLNDLQDRQYEAQERRRRELREAAAEEARTASTWPEAFRKYAAILADEYRTIEQYDVPVALAQITEQQNECRAAQSLWQATAAEAAPEIAELEAQIRQLQEGIRLSVAAHLKAQFPTGYLADARSEEEPGDFLQTI